MKLLFALNFEIFCVQAANRPNIKRNSHLLLSTKMKQYQQPDQKVIMKIH